MSHRRRPALRNAEERNALALANVRLVGHVLGRVARRYNLPWVAQDEDLFQSGVLGLLRAAELYDGRPGVAFSTYACRSIFDYVMKGVKRADPTWIPEHVHGDARAEIRARLKPVRLDQENSKGWTLGEVVPAREPGEPPTRYDLERVLAHCGTREREVIAGRARGETLDQIGARLGVCKERVRQLQLAATARLRRAAAEGVDFESGD